MITWVQVVEYDGIILEKPADAADAVRMLSMLSGKLHFVHTGVAVIAPPTEKGNDPLEHSFSVTTTVEFDSLTPELIESYVASGTPAVNS